MSIHRDLGHSRPVVCLFLFFLSSPCLLLSLLCLPFPAFHSHVMFYFSLSPHPRPSSFFFYPVSFIWPPGDLCPVTFLPRWPPVLCDYPQQMLPITVRNMPSISPLILKRLKVQLSLPLLAPPSVSVDASRPRPSPKPPDPPPPSRCL